jgi:predicted amidohydrolase YtcJ
LGIFEKVLKEENVTVEEWRPRIEHAMVMTQEDLEKTGKLGGTVKLVNLAQAHTHGEA